MSEPKEGKARKAIRETSDRLADDVAAFFEEALRSEREIWSNCTKCHRRTLVSVPDWNARQRAIETMLAEGYGKPKAEGEDGSVTVILQRYWPMRDLDSYGLSDDDKATIEAGLGVMERLNAADRHAAGIE